MATAKKPAEAAPEVKKLPPAAQAAKNAASKPAAQKSAAQKSELVRTLPTATISLTFRLPAALQRTASCTRRTST